MTEKTAPALSTGFLFALVSASLYGFNIGYARLASFAGVSGTTIVVYRVVVMLVLVAGAALAMRASLAVPREERGVLVVLGITTALVGVFYLSSVAFIPIAVAVVVFYTFPILIVLASPFVDGGRLSGSLLAIVALALLGVALVVGPVLDRLDWRGVALALAASAATATQFFAAARAPRTGVVAKTLWIHVLVLPTCVLIGLGSASLAPPSALLLAPLAAAMTIGGYVFGVVLQFMALGRISPAAAGIIYCAEPVVAAVSSTMILDEHLSAVQGIGGVVVLAAIVLNVLNESRRSPRAIVPAD